MKKSVILFLENIEVCKHCYYEEIARSENYEYGVLLFKIIAAD
jgi:hypothetical protein